MVMSIAGQSPPFVGGGNRYGINLPPQGRFGGPAYNTGISGGISGINNQVPPPQQSPGGLAGLLGNMSNAGSSGSQGGVAPNGARWGYGGALLPEAQQAGGYTSPGPPGFQDSAGKIQTGGVKPPPPRIGGAGPLGGMQQPQQQFGLGGAEQAIQAGTMGGINLLGAGQQAAMNTLGGGFNQASNFINRGVSALGGGGGGGFGGGNATAQQAQAANINQNAGQSQFQQGAAGINQFTDAGVQGQQRQLALSGALGQEAFDQARINDPAQQWLQQQGQEAVINQASALGGLGGGNVMKELSRFNQGLASQNLQQERQAANQLANQGLQAAGQAGQLQGQAGQLQGQMTQAQGQMNQQANLQNAQLGTQANISNAANQTQAGIAAGRNQTALMQAQAQLYGQGAGLAGQFAGQGAGIQANTGQSMANMLSGAGGQIGGLRYGAGQDIANSIRGTTGGLSNLQNQQGGGIADILSAYGNNASNLVTGAGGATAQNQANIAALLSNLATGQGTQASNIALQGGQSQAQAALRQGDINTGLVGDLARIYAAQTGQGNP